MITAGGRLILLCGRSFSGKSTVATHLADALDGMIISLDAINAERGLWGGDGIAISEWARTHDLARERVATAVPGKTVIIDDTSSPKFLRDDWRRLAAELGTSLILVYVDATEETIRRHRCKSRETGDRRDVSDTVLAEHLASFEPPTPIENPIRFDPDTSSLTTLVAAVRRWMS